jgi:hypothetical protein
MDFVANGTNATEGDVIEKPDSDAAVRRTEPESLH